MTTAPRRRITRRQSYTGQTVIVVTRAGEEIIGTLRGWGAMMIRVHSEGKFHEIPVVTVDGVYTV